MQQETGVSIRKSFQYKKPGRSSGFGRAFGSFQQGPALGQSHKSTAFLCSRVAQQKGLLLQHLQPPATPCMGAFSRDGLAHRAEQQASLHPRAFELLYCRLHEHTQAINQPAGSLAASSNPARCPSAQLAQGTPRLHHICLYPTLSEQSVLAWPVSRTY